MYRRGDVKDTGEDMSQPYWLSNPNKTKLKVDVAIIGSGISGLSVAYFLEKYSSKKIVIIEKHSSGYGASGRNAGFISTGSLSLFQKMVENDGITKAIEKRLFYKRNHDLLLSEFSKTTLKSKCDYKNKGSMTIALTKEKLESISQNISDLNLAGFNCVVKNIGEVYSSMKMASSGGVLDSQDGEIHSKKLLDLIEGSLRGQVLENQEVYQLNQNSLLSTDYEIEFSKVVIAINGYTELLLPEFKGIVNPIRGQMMLLENKSQFLNHNAYVSEKLCYFRQLPDNSVLIGGMRTLEEKTEVGFSDHYTTEKLQNAYEEFLKTNFPFLSKNQVLNRWAGIMGFTFDESPLVGQLTPNRFYLGGYSGHGMGKAFACAEALAAFMEKQTAIPEFIDLSRINLSKKS